jgi:hypothetical protein
VAALVVAPAVVRAVAEAGGEGVLWHVRRHRRRCQGGCMENANVVSGRVSLMTQRPV